MNNNVTEQKCDDCGAAVSNYDGVYLADGDIRSFVKLFRNGRVVNQSFIKG